MMKRFFTLLFLLALGCGLCGCGEKIDLQEGDAMDRYAAICLDMMEQEAPGCNQAAAKLIYHGDDINKAGHLLSTMPNLAHKVESMTQINENLKEYTVLIRSEVNAQVYGLGPDEYVRYYHFVGRLNGELWYFTNVNSIPEELREGLDAELYQYDDPNALN